MQVECPSGEQHAKDTTHTSFRPHQKSPMSTDHMLAEINRTWDGESNLPETQHNSHRTMGVGNEQDTVALAMRIGLKVA